jgi:predicted kinase
MAKKMTREQFLAEEVRGGRTYVMRGVPGSGKSSLADKILVQLRDSAIDARSYSADRYHLNNAGVYEWKAENVVPSHCKCLRDYTEFVYINFTHDHPEYNAAICDNTNVDLQQAVPYLAVAKAFGFEPVVVTVTCDPEVAFARNVHGVPRATFNRMAERVQRYANAFQNWTHIEIEQE